MDVKITNNANKFRNALPEQIEQALIAIGMTAETLQSVIVLLILADCGTASHTLMMMTAHTSERMLNMGNMLNLAPPAWRRVRILAQRQHSTAKNTKKLQNKP